MTTLEYRFDSDPDEEVIVVLPIDIFEFVMGFDPDRDRSASRRDLVNVLADLRDDFREGYVAE